MMLMHGKFVIEEQLPSLNEVINENRKNRQAGARMKRNIEHLIGWYIQKARAAGTLPVFGETPVVIYMEWRESTKRRDVDNIQSSQKFVLDALKKQGIIKDDRRKYVKQVFHTVFDADKDSVTIKIFEEITADGD